MQSFDISFTPVSPHLVADYHLDIRPGMTRKQVGQIYPIDGGIHSGVHVRYLVPDRPNTKVLVTFAVKRNPRDQNRIQSTDEDMVIWISAPYIEHPFCD